MNPFVFVVCVVLSACALNDGDPSNGPPSLAVVPPSYYQVRPPKHAPRPPPETLAVAPADRDEILRRLGSIEDELRLLRGAP